MISLPLMKGLYMKELGSEVSMSNMIQRILVKDPYNLTKESQDIYSIGIHTYVGGELPVCMSKLMIQI